MKRQKITKRKGMLCRSAVGPAFFRACEADGTFRDYEIAHCDLEIEITDPDAFVYKRGGKLVIDYGPKTLGLSDGEVRAETARKTKRTRPQNE